MDNTQHLIDAGELQKNDDLLDTAQQGNIEAAVRSLAARWTARYFLPGKAGWLAGSASSNPRVRETTRFCPPASSPPGDVAYSHFDRGMQADLDDMTRQGHRDRSRDRHSAE